MPLALDKQMLFGRTWIPSMDTYIQRIIDASALLRMLDMVREGTLTASSRESKTKKHIAED